MVDYLIMLGIVAFLLFLLAYKAEYSSDGNCGFFDKENSEAMRGFWCLVVILVHIPQAYQNPIQDMIGSFAYIGVTFFFMTSAYGLSAALQKKPDLIHIFWRTRLPKLIIPNWVVNVVFGLLLFVMSGITDSIISFVNINSWVKWLICCYFVLWFCHRFTFAEKYQNLIVCVLIALISIFVYILQSIGNIKLDAWCTEMMGFAWGIILFAYYENIKKLFNQNWLVKTTAICLLSLILGISYLALKHIPFWGNYVLKIILGLSILLFILLLNSKIHIGNKISSFLGNISFEIYLIHGHVFQVVEKIAPNINSIGFILLSIVLTIIFATITHSICKILLRTVK